MTAEPSMVHAPRGERAPRRASGSRNAWRAAWLAALIPAFSLLEPAAAHHSFSAVFDGEQPVAVTGTIVRVEWANPHIWFYIEVEEPDGSVTEWGFSSAPPGVLMRRGITKDVLALGTVVNVEGFRARDGSNNASGGRVTLPDGRNVFTASQEDPAP